MGSEPLIRRGPHNVDPAGLRDLDAAGIRALDGAAPPLLATATFANG